VSVVPLMRRKTSFHLAAGDVEVDDLVCDSSGVWHCVEEIDIVEDEDERTVVVLHHGSDCLILAKHALVEVWRP
jgi:hypothetical protein